MRLCLWRDDANGFGHLALPARSILTSSHIDFQSSYPRAVATQCILARNLRSHRMEPLYGWLWDGTGLRAVHAYGAGMVSGGRWFGDEYRYLARRGLDGVWGRVGRQDQALWPHCCCKLPRVRDSSGRCTTVQFHCHRLCCAWDREWTSGRIGYEPTCSSIGS
jgi:hypothetical protein